MNFLATPPSHRLQSPFPLPLAAPLFRSLGLLRPRFAALNSKKKLHLPSSNPLRADFPLRNQRHLSDEDDDEDEDDAVADEYYDHLSPDASDDEEEKVQDEEDILQPEQPPSIRSEEYKRQSVERLLARVREFGDNFLDFEELAGVYDFPIDKFQRMAIQAFLRGSSVVVSAPTSSGKTLIAEAAAVATVARERRLLYTTPLKALSNQKFRDFRKTFGENNVGLLTGDSAVNRDAKILIMTTEILRNMLYESYIYEPSSIITDVLNRLEEQRSSLLQIQDRYGVKISCGLDSQFSGMVEAWASGLTWREIMMDCAMDEGDLARLLRRTIDLLAQIPKLPDIDPRVQNNAQLASNVMDRPPISELAG